MQGCLTFVVLSVDVGIHINLATLHQVLQRTALRSCASMVEQTITIIVVHDEVDSIRFHQVLDNISVSVPASEMKQRLPFAVPRIEIHIASIGLHEVLDGVSVSILARAMQWCVAVVVSHVDIQVEAI